ncbi:MAG: hypothetical protein ACTSYR_05190 [Candidatus Odinarchaeia archaeon]
MDSFVVISAIIFDISFVAYIVTLYTTGRKEQNEAILEELTKRIIKEQKNDNKNRTV